MSHLLIVMLLVAEPDAPRAVELTPTAHEARVAELACKKDLEDCKAQDRISSKWLVIGVAVALVVGFGIGVGAGAELRR